MLAAETFDPFDVEQGRRHHETMAELRATCPVARLGSGMLVVSRHDDVMSMSTDPHMSNIDAAVRHVGATLLNAIRGQFPLLPRLSRYRFYRIVRVPPARHRGFHPS